MVAEQTNTICGARWGKSWPPQCQREGSHTCPWGWHFWHPQLETRTFLCSSSLPIHTVESGPGILQADLNSDFIKENLSPIKADCLAWPRLVGLPCSWKRARRLFFGWLCLGYIHPAKGFGHFPAMLKSLKSQDWWGSLVLFDLLKARVLKGQLMGDANYSLFPLEVKALGGHHSVGRVCAIHPCTLALGQGGISSHCNKGVNVVPGGARVFSCFAVLCYLSFCRKSLFWSIQKGNLNFVKSPTILTHVGIDRDLLPGTGPSGCRWKLPVTPVAFLLVLLQRWVQSLCSDQIFCTRALWI